MAKLTSGTIMDLDATGMFYSTVATKSHPGTFSVGVYLNEDVQVDALEKAVERLYKRLPHFNVGLKRVGNTYKNIVLKDSVKPIYDENPTNFCAYFEEGEVTSRVLYGKNYITMEVLHSVCDGGTLTKALKALIIEYFNILGYKTPYQEINLDEEPREEDYMDCGALYKKEFTKDENINLVEPFRYHGTKTKSTKKTYQFNCQEIKLKAKSFGATVTEYIIAMMVLEFDKKRIDDKPIVFSVPLDARKYFNAYTLRNFVIAVTVSVTKWDSFSDLLSQIHSQLTGVTKEMVEQGVSRSEILKNSFPEMTFDERKEAFQAIDLKVAGGSTMTSVISNVGLVRFDPLIQSKIQYMDFTLCPEEHCAYQFACVTCGSVLALTVTSGIEEHEVIDNIANSLK